MQFHYLSIVFRAFPKGSGSFTIRAFYSHEKKCNKLMISQRIGDLQPGPAIPCRFLGVCARK
ncbi:MAG: hypothetical protein JXR70_14965 [Spirochaetales bacterium]|nr:hypothetical protein [Spirochaetales bacterium]